MFDFAFASALEFSVGVLAFSSTDKEWGLVYVRVFIWLASLWHHTNGMEWKHTHWVGA